MPGHHHDDDDDKGKGKPGTGGAAARGGGSTTDQLVAAARSITLLSSQIEGILSTTNTVKVFNRWGQLVFETNNYRNNWGAVGVPEGTYFYEVIVDRHDEPYTGHLTILRN